jgi:hypothetical protein
MPVKLAGFSGLEFDVPRDAEVLLELVEAAYAVRPRSWFLGKPGAAVTAPL